MHIKYSVKLSIKTLEEYIFGSLKIIKEDAPSLGVFSCVIIELLGRFLRIHEIEKRRTKKTNKEWFRRPHKEWFYDFIENYLKKINQKYYEQRDILWKILRCESAHAILADSAVIFSLQEKLKESHLEAFNDPRIDKDYLVISTSKFVEDLEKAVSLFFNDVRNSPILEEKCQKTYMEIHEYGQKIIKGEIKEGKLKIKQKLEMNIG